MSSACVETVSQEKPGEDESGQRLASFNRSRAESMTQTSCDFKNNSTSHASTDVGAVLEPSRRAT